MSNHGCKTQIAFFNKKVNITGFSRLEILNVCMEYINFLTKAKQGLFRETCRKE